MPAPDPLLCLDDVERAAADVVPPDIRDFVTGGAGAEATLAANRTALSGIHLVPRVLTDVSHCGLTTTLLDSSVAMPVGIAPMAFQCLLHPDGELALARAARDAGVVFTASMLGSYPIEEVTSTGADTWFQLYWLRDRGALADLLQRAEQAGCRAIMLTVDVPRMGRRLRDIRNRFTLPAHVAAANLSGPAAAKPDALDDSSAPMVHTADTFDPSLSWADLDWLRDRTTLPLIVKGILHPEDASRAAGSGVDAIVVSNHGGRQLDGAIPSITALPAVRDAVEDRCEVLLDSGIRNGVDVVRAMALGASGVLLGRPALWGLAVDGERGAARVLSLLRTEIEDAMVLTGCPDVGRISTVDTWSRL